MKTIDLGVKQASLTYDGINDSEVSLSDLKELLKDVNYSIVSLTKYRPPAFSWTTNRNTLVLKLSSESRNLLGFGMLLLRSQPNEFEFLITDENDLFARLWWD